MITLRLLSTNIEYEFVGCYRKGKKPNGDLRFLLECVKDRDKDPDFPDATSEIGEKVMFWIVDDHPVLGCNFQFSDSVKVTAAGVRQKNYNYYFVDNDHTKLEAEMQRYKAGRKFFPVPGPSCLHTKAYQPTIEFNGVLY